MRQQPPTPVEGPVSIARPHGEACFHCGAVSKPLAPAGSITLVGTGRVWRIVTCGCDAGEPIEITSTDQVARWLTSSSPAPAVAHEAWRDGRPAMLRTGNPYDAVRMPRTLVHAAAGNSAPDVVTDMLAEILDGPVICHPNLWYYALVPPETCKTWRSAEAVVRGPGAWLGVPRPDRTQPAPVTPYWAVPVEQAGKLCSSDAVAELLQAGRARLEGTAP
ncbi:hypothetical protein ACWGBX_27495 [Streptomyces sp. NPDC055037]